MVRIDDTQQIQFSFNISLTSAILRSLGVSLVIGILVLLGEVVSHGGLLIPVVSLILILFIGLNLLGYLELSMSVPLPGGAYQLVHRDREEICIPGIEHLHLTTSHEEHTTVPPDHALQTIPYHTVSNIILPCILPCSVHTDCMQSTHPCPPSLLIVHAFSPALISSVHEIGRIVMDEHHVVMQRMQAVDEGFRRERKSIVRGPVHPASPLHLLVAVTTVTPFKIDDQVVTGDISGTKRRCNTQQLLLCTGTSEMLGLKETVRFLGQ